MKLRSTDLWNFLFVSFFCICIYLIITRNEIKKMQYYIPQSINQNHTLYSPYEYLLKRIEIWIINFTGVGRFIYRSLLWLNCWSHFSLTTVLWHQHKICLLFRSASLLLEWKWISGCIGWKDWRDINKCYHLAWEYFS